MIDNKDLNTMLQMATVAPHPSSPPVKLFLKDSVQLSLERNLASNTSLSVIAPSQEEIQHVSVLFKDRKLDNINVINYGLVSNIARQEFVILNNRLKEFTSKISIMKSPGLFKLVEELSKSTNDADLPGIWERTVNAKPSVSARVKSWFSPSALNENLQQQYQSVYKLLTERSKGLEVKLSDIETKLVQQKHEQENNIQALSSSFEMYFNSFQEVRKEFVFILYLEEFYKQSIAEYIQQVGEDKTIHTGRKLAEYQSILGDIENKRLVLHGALIKFPIIVKQNENLIAVCKNILKEIDNTLLNNFTSIRSNLMGLAISLNAQQALLGTNSAKLLDEQSSKLAMKINSDLVIQAELFSGESRLREAETIKSLVYQIKELNEATVRAKQQSQQNILKATDILNESTSELKYLLGQS